MSSNGSGRLSPLSIEQNASPVVPRAMPNLQVLNLQAAASKHARSRSQDLAGVNQSITPREIRRCTPGPERDPDPSRPTGWYWGSVGQAPPLGVYVGHMRPIDQTGDRVGLVEESLLRVVTMHSKCANVCELTGCGPCRTLVYRIRVHFPRVMRGQSDVRRKNTKDSKPVSRKNFEMKFSFIRIISKYHS
jgi:hypothetical protein